MKCSICIIFDRNPPNKATHFFRPKDSSEYRGYWRTCEEHSTTIEGIEPATEEEVIIFQTERLLE